MMRNRANAASAAASNEIQSVPTRIDSSAHQSRQSAGQQPVEFGVIWMEDDIVDLADFAGYVVNCPD
jgi:hypothetical protein